MTSIEPKLPPQAQKQLSIVNIKLAVIKALTAALQDQEYPDEKIRGIHISQEYPLTQEQYPTIWVNFSFSKLQNAGIGYSVIEEEQIRQEWYYEGQVTLTVISLSSYERDVYASQLLNLLAFSRMDPIASKFDDVLNSYPNISLSIDRDTLTPGGQSVDPGTPWSETIFTYIDSYTAKMIGQIRSTFSTTPEFLRELQVLGIGTVPGEKEVLVTSESFTEDPGNTNPWY